ncbi:MAG: hypothetical protein ABIP55_05810 [Tepidisphaeraceae bacterium]
MMRVHAVTVPSADPSEDDAGEAPGPNPLLLVHEAMKGKYRLALALALLGGVIGAAVGYFASPPLFATTAQVQIKPNLPRILYQNEQNEQIPRFESFVESQLSLIRSNRVFDTAAQNPIWKEKKITLPTSVAMSNGFTVWRTKNGEIISVTMEHPDRRVAQLTVFTMVKAYEALYVAAESASDVERSQVLEARRDTLTSQRNDLLERIHSAAQEYGSGSLEPIYGAKVSELNKLDAEMNRIKLALAHAESVGHGPASNGPASNDPASQPAGGAMPALPPPTLLDVSRDSADVRQQVTMLGKAKFDLTRMISRMGAGHVEVKEQQRLIAQLQQNLDDAVKAYGLLRPDGTGGPAGAGELAALRNSEARVRKLYESVKEETATLGRKQLQIEQLRGEADLLKGKLDEVNTRIDELSVESATAGRINVISYGERPLTPIKDHRKQFTAAGGLGGSLLGPAILILVGLLDPRFRSTTDARAKLRGPTRILGALPYLPDLATDPEELASAAHGIHQIRVLLQVQGARDGHRVFALTSSTPGVGKTSIALALGYSFAGSSSRTLLVDLDLMSGGLSSRTVGLPKLRAPQLLARTLSPVALTFIAPDDVPRQAAHETYVSPVQKLQEFEGSLNAAFETIEGSAGERDGRPVTTVTSTADAAMHASSVPIEQSGLHHGMQLQSAAAPGKDPAPSGGLQMGLLDVMEGMPLSDCLTQTEEPNLSVLSLGGAGPQHVSRLSPEVLRRIIREARGRYDTVLIDTGPIMGSIEASMVASEVDAVLMAVSRGEQRSLTEQAMELVLSTGARLGGIIFNRAASMDVMVSGSSNRSGFDSAARLNGGRSSQRSNQRLGPLARAVVTSGHSAN